MSAPAHSRDPIEDVSCGQCQYQCHDAENEMVTGVHGLDVAEEMGLALMLTMQQGSWCRLLTVKMQQTKWQKN